MQWHASHPSNLAAGQLSSSTVASNVLLVDETRAADQAPSTPLLVEQRIFALEAELVSTGADIVVILDSVPHKPGVSRLSLRAMRSALTEEAHLDDKVSTPAVAGTSITD